MDYYSEYTKFSAYFYAYLWQGRPGALSGENHTVQEIFSGADDFIETISLSSVYYFSFSIF
jgi:hypothetical protein